MKAIPFRLILLAATIEILLIGIRLLADLANHIVEAITLLLLTSSVYIVAVYCVLSRETGQGGDSTALRPGERLRTVAFILAASLVFRATVFSVYPTLSDDLYRYRWEGKLQANGGNPYQVRPNDPSWANLRDSTWLNVGSKDFKSIYGPLIEVEQRAAYSAVRRIRNEYAQVFWFKLPAIFAELATIAAVALLLRVRGAAPERLLIYAWSPVPVVEFWIGGHNDAFVVLLMVLTFAAAASNRWAAAYLGISLAVAAKVWPLVLLPALLVRSYRAGWRNCLYALLLLPIGVVSSLPYWSPVIENVRFGSGFVGGWRNNDSLFGLLVWWSGGDLYHAKYMAFALIAAVTAGAALSRWGLEKAALVTIVFALFISANCHPWYLTWIVPLLTLFPSVPILLWTAVMPLSYSVLIGWKVVGAWNGSTPFRWFVYIPVFGLVLAYGYSSLVTSSRKKQRSASVLR